MKSILCIYTIFFFRCVLAAVNVDLSCITPNGKQAECVSLYLCEPVLNMLRSPNLGSFDYVRKSQCGILKDFMVCCEKRTEITSTENSDIVNDDILPDNTICGYQASDDRERKSNRTALDEFPWMALIYGKNNHSSCTGTFISKRYVLTTAHCVQNRQNVISVALGVYNKNKNISCLNNGFCTEHSQKVGVETIIPHEKYKGISYDVALLRLAEEVYFSDFLRPICLPFDDDIKPPKYGDILWTSGWGTTKVDGKQVEIKQKIKHKFLGNSDCSRYFNMPVIDDSVICTIPISEKNICKGESGGPVMFYNNFQWYAEGLLSFGVSCDESHPQGATNIRKVLDWIKKNVKA